MVARRPRRGRSAEAAMEHDAAALLVDLIARLVPGHPVPGTAGEWIVPLAERPGRQGWAPAELHEEDGAVAAEHRPPRPGRIVVVNGSDRAVVVYAGAVLRGGLADRAVVRTALVPGRAGRVVRVEALEPRWWPSGPLVPDGTVEPLRAGLLELGDRRGVPAARARTAMWSAHRDPAEVAAAPGGGPGGWIAVLARRVVAASLHPPRRPPTAGAAPPSEEGVRPPTPGSPRVTDLAHAFLHRLLTEVEWAGPGPELTGGALDDVALRLTPLGGSGAHLTAALLSDDLSVAAVRRP
ncbi:MAG: hypothetical protein JWM18_4518 [Chloroflexi bacterium]|jgi:hypothetical protein|nr:hypothetical protein [Chloroflexota bacterium]